MQIQDSEGSYKVLKLMEIPSHANLTKLLVQTTTLEEKASVKYRNEVKK